MKINIRFFEVGLLVLLCCFVMPAAATTPCPPCHSGPNCVPDCNGSEVCCDDSCCGGDCCDDNCLDCNSNESCCGSSCCDNLYCCNNAFCCNSGEMCCGGSECCDINSCCDDICCNATQYCCGGEVCCEANEVCCPTIIPAGYYCSSPCWDEVTDTNSCSKDNEDDYKCTGCKQISPPTCGTYRDYTDLEIGECHDGCPANDWNSSEEICYKEKECFPMLKEDNLCIECEGEKSCFPIIQFGSPPECQTVGECIIQIACDIAFICWQSTPGDTVVNTVKKDTCECD